MLPVRPEDIYDYKLLSSMKLSPSGRNGALIVSHACEKDNDYKNDLYMICREREEGLKALTHDGSVSWFEWEDDSHILFSAVRTQQQKEQMKDGLPVSWIYRLDINGGEAELVWELPIAAGSIKVLGEGRFLLSAEVDVNEPDLHLADEEGRKKYAQQLKEEKDYEVIDESPFWFNGAGMTNKKRSGLYVFDANSKECKRITPAALDVGAVDAADGRVYYAGETIDVRRTYREGLYVYDLKSDDTRTLQEPELGYHLVRVLGDGLIVAATDHKTYGVNENPKFYLTNADTGEMTQIADPDICIGNAVLTDIEYGAYRSSKADGEHVYFVTSIGSRAVLMRINCEGKLETVVEREGAVVDFDVQADRLIFTAMFDQELQEVYETAEGKAVKLTSFTEKDLKDRYIAKPEKLVIESQGYEIDGWVLYPIDYDPNKSYPAVLDVHGGPKCAYGEMFFHEMQMWAGMGYFVFFCNPFGGEGKGNEFAFMRDRYGTIDYQNIMDFTDAVLDRFPQIDRSRVCETGGSYGGFMTNWIVTHTDRFCCAATQRSISNWISMYGISDIGPMFTIDQCGKDIMDEEGVQQAWRHSPLKYAADCHTPLLFLHSDEDYRCPISEGYQLYTVLAQHGVPTRMCVFHGENHELSRSGKPKHRIRRLTEMNKWFEKYSRS